MQRRALAGGPIAAACAARAALGAHRGPDGVHSQLRRSHRPDRPVFSILLSGHHMDRLLFLLGLYAAIVVIDQLLLQPLIMKRITRVPIWASILAPIALGIAIPFWGVLLAPPLLAVVYAFRRPRARPGPVQR